MPDYVSSKIPKMAFFIYLFDWCDREYFTYATAESVMVGMGGWGGADRARPSACCWRPSHLRPERVLDLNTSFKGAVPKC